MSSRALRKAQQQREEEERLKRLQQEADDLEESEEDDILPAPSKKSAFDLLREQEDENAEEPSGITDDEDDGDAPEPAAVSTKPSSNKQKKKKKKAKSKSNQPKEDDSHDIDAALQQLKVSTAAASTSDPAEATNQDDSVLKVFQIDKANLRAENEMRRLFGRTAVEADAREEQAGGQRRNRGQMAGVAAAMGRRQGQRDGRASGLGLLGMRRNPFIQGKEQWPSGTSGGLSMEIVERRPGGTIEYRFVHNTAYQAVQGEFDICVSSMDIERLMHHLQMNPYHISTLLQVSEVAKQDRDHSTSGDLLERALFAFGRSLHSTFADSLAQGKARLDFRRPENREFWLAVSRYITNLTMRATWRTVFEWAKLLLSLDPEHDPYRLCMVIDQYAIRARQPQQLIDLANNGLVNKDWNALPNIQFSLGLALVQTGEASKGKQVLFKASNNFPWVVACLYQEMNIDASAGIWGKTPRTDWEKLCTELYATRAKDIWNVPEAQNLLVEVSSAVTGGEPSIPERSISIDEGRHVLLFDKPELTALVPRSITSKLTSSSDPLPPVDDLRSYTSINPRRTQQVMVPTGRPGDANQREMLGILNSLGALIPMMAARLGLTPGAPRDQEVEDADMPDEEELEEMLRETGMTRPEFEARMRRLNQLYTGSLARDGDAEDVDEESDGDEDGDEDEDAEEQEELDQ